MSDRPDRCETCRFWEVYHNGGPDEDPQYDPGECRRHPPTLLQTMELRRIDATANIYVGKAWWPETMRDDWCGEWEGMIQPAGNGDTTALTADQRALLLRPVAALDLPYRQRRVIVFHNRDEGVFLVGDLVARTADELLEWRKFGPTSLAVVRAKLAEHGLHLKGD